MSKDLIREAYQGNQVLEDMVTHSRERIFEPKETPEITGAMKHEIGELIGEEELKRHPEFHPNSLEAFYSNQVPAYILGGLRFDCYRGPKDWDNAWQALKEGVSFMKTMGIFD